jgi:hypothetical protein
VGGRERRREGGRNKGRKRGREGGEREEKERGKEGKREVLLHLEHYLYLGTLNIRSTLLKKT